MTPLKVHSWSLPMSMNWSWNSKSYKIPGNVLAMSRTAHKALPTWFISIKSNIFCNDVDGSCHIIEVSVTQHHSQEAILSHQNFLERLELGN